MSYHGLKKKYKVSIRQYTGSKGYWVGTQIIFSGKDAVHCYNLIKTQKLDLETLTMDQHTLSLGRIDICFSRTNDFNHTIKAIHAHTQDDAYWLKLHHFSGSIKNNMFHKLQEDQDKAHDSFDID